MDWVDLVGIELKCSLLLVCAGLVVLLFRRLSASQRHLVWMLALLGTLLVPVAYVAMPQWKLAVVPRETIPVPLRSVPTVRVSVSPVLAGHSALESTGAEVGPVAEADAESFPVPVEVLPAELPSVPINGYQIAWMVWISGVLLVLLPLPIGYVAALRIARKASPPTGAWLATYDRLKQKLALRRCVVVLERDGGQMPMAFGIFRPVIIVPSVGRNWPEEERESVLAHELAHVKRHDCLIHLLCSFATALHWFNPLYVVAMRRMRLEREHACDDYVLGSGAEATAYADQLLMIARTQPCRVPLYGAAITMARRNVLEGRLLAILDGQRNRKALGVGVVVATVVLFMGVAAPLAAVTVAEEERNEPLAEISAETEDEILAMLVETNVAWDAMDAEPATMPNEERVASSADVAIPLLGEWFMPSISSDGKRHLLIEENGQALLEGSSLRKRMQWTVNYDELVFTAPGGINTANLDPNGNLIFREDGKVVAVFGRSDSDVVLHPEPVDEATAMESKLSKEQIAFIQSISRIEKQDQALAEAAMMASRSRNVDAVLEALNNMSSTPARDGIVGQCVDQLVSIGMYDEADRVARKISSSGARMELLNRVELSRRQWMAKEMRTRLQITRGMSSFSERDDALAKIAVDAGSLGDVEIALMALGNMSSFSLKDEAASRCADQFIALSMSAEAGRIANTISSFSDKDDVLARIAQGKPQTSRHVPQSVPAPVNQVSYSYSTDVPLNNAQAAQVQAQMQQIQKQMEAMAKSGTMQNQMKGMQQQLEAMQKQMESMMKAMGTP
ncbi:MAG: M56 family metallopeptidase [Pontiellaceae bacterium]|nr:M56 family metallopeptidase [Pontiellaceae bacterium]MBN2784660.1 M56 family metallopeptidase [Pontiellaceae bacterium]